MNEAQMAAALRGVPLGSLLFVSYEAGRPPTPRAVREAERHTRIMSRRHFVGTLEGVWMTRDGQTVLTLFAYNRDREIGSGMVEGGYRTFNPSVGNLLSVEVIERASDSVDEMCEAASRLSTSDLERLNRRVSGMLRSRHGSRMAQKVPA